MPGQRGATLPHICPQYGDGHIFFWCPLNLHSAVRGSTHPLLPRRTPSYPNHPDKPDYLVTLWALEDKTQILKPLNDIIRSPDTLTYLWNQIRFHRAIVSNETIYEWYLCIKVIQFQFSPTWSCVSLPRPTTSSGWKLLIFVLFKTNYLQILMFKHAFHSELQWWLANQTDLKTSTVISSDEVVTLFMCVWEPSDSQ